MCWAFWLNRNDVVFTKTNTTSFLQVVFRGDVLDQALASKLSKEEERVALKEGCNRLEVLVMEVFVNLG